jgi:hypothetical protein
LPLSVAERAAALECMVDALNGCIIGWSALDAARQKRKLSWLMKSLAPIAWRSRKGLICGRFFASI